MVALISLAGRTGVGKTTLGSRLQETLRGKKVKSIVLDDDVVRRKILNKTLSEKLTPFDYGPVASQEVIKAMQDGMITHIRKGITVINVSGYWSDDSRAYIERLAQKLGVSFYGFWLDAPEDVLRQRIDTRLASREKAARLDERLGHASDADSSILRYCANVGTVTWPILDAAREQDDLVREIIGKIVV